MTTAKRRRQAERALAWDKVLSSGTIPSLQGHRPPTFRQTRLIFYTTVLPWTTTRVDGLSRLKMGISRGGWAMRATASGLSRRHVASPCHGSGVQALHAGGIRSDVRLFKFC